MHHSEGAASPQGSGKHCPRGIHHRRDPTILPATDGRPQAHILGGVAPGSVSGIRTAPGWEQLLPSRGTGAAAGS